MGRRPPRLATKDGFLQTSNGTITTFDPPGSTFTMPTSINSGGEITGNSSDGIVAHGFVVPQGIPTGRATTTAQTRRASDLTVKGCHCNFEYSEYASRSPAELPGAGLGGPPLGELRRTSAYGVALGINKYACGKVTNGPNSFSPFAAIHPAELMATASSRCMTNPNGPIGFIRLFKSYM
jgi:hypothetical protein